MSETDSNSLHVTAWGSGQPVVLVHGSNAVDPDRSWAGQRELSGHYRLLIPHRPGYGLSAPATQPGFDADAEALIATMNEGGHLVGFSYGGIIALLAAGKRPDLVRSLALIEPPAYDVTRGTAFADDMIARMTPVYELAGKLSASEFHYAFMEALTGRSPQRVELSAEELLAYQAAMLEPAPWNAPVNYNAIAAAHFPKLVFSGGWNESLEALCDALARLIGAKRVVLAGAGHAVHKSPEFNRHIAEFWRSTHGV